MKRMKTCVVLAAALLGVCAGSAYAQEMIVAKVPFPFVIRGQQFAAGRYSLSNEEGVLMVRGIDRSGAVGRGELEVHLYWTLSLHPARPANSGLTDHASRSSQNRWVGSRAHQSTLWGHASGRTQPVLRAPRFEKSPRH